MSDATMKWNTYSFICTLAMFQPSLALVCGDVCYDNPFAGESNPVIKYLKNTNLVSRFLAKFPPADPLSAFGRFYQTLLDESTSDSAPNNFVSWELAYFAAAFRDKKPENMCIFYSLPRVVIEFENTGNIATLECLIKLLKNISDVALYYLIEKVFDQYNCTNYTKYVNLAPECINCNNCLDVKTDISNLEELYNIDKSYAQEFSIPWNDNYHEDIFSYMLTTNQPDLWATGVSTIGTWLHTLYLVKAGIASDPVIVNVIIKLVNIMEQIIYEKDCTCQQRVESLTNSANEISLALNSDLELLFSKLSSTLPM